MKKILAITVAAIVLAIGASAQTITTMALLGVGLKAYDAAPNASYYLKVTKDGDVKYSPISSCQMALEKTYDLFIYQNVDEVRIISENPTINGSCRNRTYYPGDVEEIRKRRDGWSGGF